MDGTIMLWALGGLQSVNLFLLGWIKLDIKNLWTRTNSHRHSIECTVDKCKPVTTGVVIHNHGEGG